MEEFGTFFSGFGGADIGLKMAGLGKSRWAVEKNEAIADCFRANFRETNVVVSDIRDLEPTSLSEVEFIHASPPCQEYSTARRLKNRHPEADAGLALIKFIKYLQPKYFTLENVPGYAASESFKSIVDCLNKAKYFVYWDVLDASSFGVPQSRKRLILRASKESFLPMLQQQEQKGWFQAVKDLIPGLEECDLADWQSKLLKDNPKRPLLMPRSGANVKNARGREWWEPAPTIRALEKCGGSHWADIITRKVTKKISPRVTSRLMTFPDDFILPDKPALSQQGLGNAVPPEFMRGIASSLLQ